MHLEALSNTEEETEMPSLSNIGRPARVIVDHRINRWIQVIAEIKPNRPNRRSVSRTQSNRVREVIEVTCPDCVRGCDGRHIPARIPIRLSEPQETRKHITRVLKYIPHIVKQHEADTVTYIRKRGCRHSKLDRIHKCSRPANRIARLQVSRPCSIDRKPSV